VCVVCVCVCVVCVCVCVYARLGVGGITHALAVIYAKSLTTGGYMSSYLDETNIAVTP
jgi:hypothetical protein